MKRINKNIIKLLSIVVITTIFAFNIKSIYGIVYDDHGVPKSYSPKDHVILPQNAKKPGYQFEGWYETSDFVSDKVTEILPGNFGEKEFWAKWDVANYTITYVLDGGVLDSAKGTYTTFDEDYTLPIPFKEGNIFAGWFESEDFSGDAITVLENGSLGNKTYYARWIEDTVPDYLFFEAVENTNVKFEKHNSPTFIPTLQYSMDKEEWHDYTIENVISLTAGDKVYFKGDNTKFNTDPGNYIHFTSTGKIKGGGNIMSLLDSTCESLTIPNVYCFVWLFNNNDKLISSPKLPAVNLSAQCYQAMFCGCSGLLECPELPALNLKASCYNSMFTGCTSLTTLPELPSKTILYASYIYMFSGCSNIKVSKTQTGNYTIPYRFPRTGTGISLYELWNSGMLEATGGTFTGDPQMNTIYYLYDFGDYRINYILNGGILNNSKNSYRSTDERYILPTPTKFGFIFDGWYLNEDFTGTIMGAIPSGSEGDITLYAKWKQSNANYFRIYAEEDTNIAIVKHGSPYNATLYYSYDKANWEEYVFGTNLPIEADHSIYWAGNNEGFSKSTSNYYNLTSTGKIKAYGDIVSLLDSSVPIAQTITDILIYNEAIFDGKYCFAYLFKNCSNLIEVSPTLLSNIYTMDEGIYYGMFQNCSLLKQAPLLPSKKLVSTLFGGGNHSTSCYSHMFDSCTSLIEAPQLLSTELPATAYEYMFNKCTSLVTAPNLPATAIGNNCYSHMFDKCTALTSAPSLPATKTSTFSVLHPDGENGLPDYCYSYMFNGCTALTSAPSLPANTVGKYSYSYMFNGCKNLKNMNSISATTLNSYCFKGMFTGCNSLINIPSSLPASQLTDYCYSHMFDGCSSLTTMPTLNSTKLADNCYEYMFYNCTSLRTIKTLPATVLANYCYSNMFYGCTALTSAPQINATTLASNCCQYMFYNCTSLTTPPILKATTLTQYCYYCMFQGCTKIKLSTTRTGTYTSQYRIPYSGTISSISTNALTYMFTNTGGTFKGTPNINTAYYYSLS